MEQAMQYADPAATQIVDLVINPRAVRVPRKAGEFAAFNRVAFDEVLHTVRGWPGYAPTPLVHLRGAAAMLGVADVAYKDEGLRFGLGSFKAVGGAYAVARLAGRNAGQQLTVASATDGNHGRSVAWGAQLHGFPCVIYVHAGVSEARVEAIARYGADVRRVAGNYDDSVRQCAADAASQGWHVVSDTSYPGYQDIPRDVMLGYTVLMSEVYEQMGEEVPTHVFVQCGVGGLAAAVAAFFCAVAAERRPTIVVVEPERADCLLRSARAGQLHRVEGDLDTVMAGLACGEPSEIAWDILREAGDAFVSIRDQAALAAMKMLAFPTPGDPAVVSGESGAAGLAGLHAVASDNETRRSIGLTAASRVLLIGTEGDTDAALYERIVGCSGADVRARNA
jgi:diaminopropionate ammonia-lyase